MGAEGAGRVVLGLEREPATRQSRFGQPTASVVVVVASEARAKGIRAGVIVGAISALLRLGTWALFRLTGVLVYLAAIAIIGETRRILRRMRRPQREAREGHRVLTVMRIVGAVVIAGLLIADLVSGASRTLLHVAEGCSIAYAALLMLYVVTR